jgi:hypothetical protein
MSQLDIYAAATDLSFSLFMMNAIDTTNPIAICDDLHYLSSGWKSWLSHGITSVRVKVEGIHRESPRCARGTLLIQCRLHKTKKHTRNIKPCSDDSQLLRCAALGAEEFGSSRLPVVRTHAQHEGAQHGNHDAQQGHTQHRDRDRVHWHSDRLAALALWSLVFQVGGCALPPVSLGPGPAGDSATGTGTDPGRDSA